MGFIYRNNGYCITVVGVFTFISGMITTRITPTFYLYLRKISFSDKKLSRGISKATDNVNLVSKARSEFAQEIWEAIDASRTPIFIETPVFTFTLPDLSIYSGGSHFGVSVDN